MMHMNTSKSLIILYMVALSILTAFPLFAASWEGKIITKLDFEQNGYPLEESLIQMIDMKVGTPYQTESVRAAMERLYSTGIVTAMKVEVTEVADDQIAVKWILSQKQVVSVLTLSGLHRLSRTEILGALHFVPNEALDAVEWEKRILRLTSFYKDEGYFNIQIASQFRTFPQNTATTEILLNIEAGDRVRINTLRFTGMPVFPDMVLRLSVLSQNPEYFSQKLMTRDINRLKAYYKKMGYRKAIIGPPIIDFLPNRHAVNISLPIMASTKSDLFFHGVNRFSFPEGEALDKLIRIDQESGDDDTVLEDAARAIEMFYRDRGYYFTKVSLKVKRVADEDRMEAHFTVENMTRARIRRINFSGNNSFSEKRLRKLVKLKKEGFLTRTHFTEEQLREDAENVALFYKKEGFLEVRVMPDIPFDEEKKWATLTFRIEEGKYTWVETISIEGADRVSEKTIRDVLLLQKGDPYNKGIIQEGARQILTLYSRLGYLSAKVESTASFSTDGSRAQLNYKIAEGEPSFLGSLTVTGNLTTKEHVLVREMAIKKGDPFDNEKVLLSQQQLSQTGLFSSIHFETEHPTEDKSVQDLRLTVAERPRWALEFGYGYLDKEGPRGFLGMSNRNIFGTGRKLNARVEGGTIERRYSLNYKEPHVFSYNADATVGATYFKTQAGRFNPYDEEALVGTLSFEKKFATFWKGVVLYEYKDTNITNVKSGVTLTNQDAGKLIIASINPSFIRDTRDDPFNPTSGSIHVTTLRTAALSLGSEVQMVKMTHQSSFFFSPIPRTTIALSLRSGGARKFGETNIIPLSERFFSGGRSTVRGYAQNQIGVLGETTNNGEATGGNALLIFNEELRVSLYKSFGMVFFFDHGNVWREFDEIEFNQIKSTTGIGFRINTPIGPLRVDWGYKLNREALESASEYQFMLGHVF